MTSLAAGGAGRDRAAAARGGGAHRRLVADLASGGAPAGRSLVGELEGWRIGLGLAPHAFEAAGAVRHLRSWQVRRLLMLLGTARAAPQALRTPGARTVGLSWQGIPTDARTASRRHPRAYCRALVRGVTLAAGYLYDPEHGYHLEWTVPHAEADRLARCLGHLGVRARRGAGRRRGVRLYAEEGEAISSLLTEMGAAESLLAWENVRALRQVRGRVNREVNAETANLKRSVAAGLRQADRLATLSRHDLPPPLRAVLEARLANPTASLGELAELLGLGRSAVHHRLRGLERRAQDQAPPRRERDR